MKKIVRYFILGVIVSIIGIINSKAASCSISVSSPSSAVVGQSFNVTVKVSSNAALGSWNYTLDYNSLYVRLNSGSLHIVDYGNGSKSSVSYTYSFTALKSGTTEFKPTGASVIDFNSENECLSSTNKATINMKTQQEIEDAYSRNNNLSNLGIEGTTLAPEFNTDTLEYSVTMPPDTTTINVIAEAQDKTANVEGLGQREVVDGINKIEVIVTAQHGEKKTYVINVTVEELNPIEVKVDNKKYTLVRKNGKIEEIPTGFEESTIKIDDQDISCYKSDITKLTLVTLKDDNGNLGLFIYDEKTKKYSSFNVVKGNFSNLLVIEGKNKSFLKYFKKTMIKYHKEKINGYKLKGSKYYLVYAKNLETGKEGYYSYNEKDDTFQLFNEDILKVNDEKIMYMTYIIYGLSGLLVLIILIKLFKRKNNKKKDESYDIDDIKLTDEPNIKKIENDEYEVIKKSKKEKLREVREAKRKLDSKKPSYKSLFDEEDDE